jgi:outer membrane receptor protein involved in Fe transport
MNEMSVDPLYGANNYVGYRMGYIYPSPSDPTGFFYIRNQNKDDFDRDTRKGRVSLDGAKHPVSFSGFLQDKMEFEGLILNLGLRYDMFNAGAKRIRDFYNPLGTPGIDSVFEVGSEDYTNSKSDHKISPRVSISFPVSEKTVFRASYGKFFQQPNLNNLYIGAYWYSRMVTNPPFATWVQNPNLKAEESTQYEVGMQRGLTDNLRLDISAYYKDINNLVNVANTPTNPDAGYYGLILYNNEDRGIVKGVVLSMDLRRVNKISSRVAYTIQWANGTGSGDNSGFRSAWLGYEATKFNAPLNFDRRHSFNTNIDIRNGKKEGPAWGGYLLENAGANFLITASSGTPYTPINPSAISLQTPAGKVSGRRNSQYGPWNFRIDLKADKNFELPYGVGMQVYIQIINLLDTRNATNVFASSGSADDDGYRATAQGQALVAQNGPEYNAFYDIRMKNSLFYDTPRQARIGVVLNF